MLRQIKVTKERLAEAWLVGSSSLKDLQLLGPSEKYQW